MTAFTAKHTFSTTNLHNAFDTRMIAELYDNDLNHFGSMLAIFNRTVEQDMKELATALRANQQEPARRITHRVKAKFSMVALPHHRAKLEMFERQIKRTVNCKKLWNQYVQLERDVRQVLQQTRRQEVRISRGG